MDQFIIYLKAFIFLVEFKVAVTSSDINAVKENPSQLAYISNFLENFLRMGIKSLDSPETKRDHRSCSIMNVEKIIADKLFELKPFLDDDDHDELGTEDELTLKGNETTIIEFVPKDKENLREKKEPFKENLKKYKSLRNEIDKALMKESVSHETRELVINTLDSMIANMVESKCSWKRTRIHDKRAKDYNSNTGKNSSELAKFLGIADNWNQEWQKIRRKYSNAFENNKKSVSPDHIKTLMLLMDKLPSFFSRIFRDGENLAKRYKIKCQRIDNDTKEKSPLRNTEKQISESKNKLRSRNKCPNKLWMCTDELKEFLLYIYSSVNSTTVKVLKDYVEMYKVDVIIYRKYYGKGVLGKLIEATNTVEDKICKTFGDNIRKFVIIAKKKTSANIEILNKFVKQLLDQVKKETRDSLETEFQFMKHMSENDVEKLESGLTLNVLGDIDINLGDNLGRLANDISEGLCKRFETCNGIYTIGNSRRTRNDRDTVFVSVQLTFDDELKNVLFKNTRRMTNSVISKRSDNKNTTINYHEASFSMKKEYIKNYGVTRTTQVHNPKVVNRKT